MKFLFLSTFLLMAQAPLALGQRKLVKEGLDLFIDIPELRQRKDQCLRAIEKDDTISLPDCLIKGTEDGKLGPITPAVREKMIQALEAKARDDESSPEYEALELIRTQKKMDPAIKKLGEFYFKKLNESLYGKHDAEKKLYVSHSAFYEIYKSQVSKNLIESLSSYCIEAERSKAFILSQDKAKRMSVRKKSIKQLKKIEGEGADAVSAGYKDWEVCMQAIQNICHRTIYKHKKAKLVINYSSTLTLDEKYNVEEADYNYSRIRACSVVGYLKIARQTILKITEIQRLINYVDGDPSKGRKDPVNWFKNLIGKDDFKSTGKTYDELTSMTSGELAKSGFLEEDKKILKRITEDCLKNSNMQACREFLNEEVDEQYKLAAEYALKLEAMMEKIEKMKPDKLKKFLQEQGYEDKRIQELEKFAEELKTEVIERFRAEKELLITQLWEEIRAKTLAKTDDDEKIKSKIKKIAEELSGRGEEFIQLVHYNNIISGYLTVSGRPGDKGKVRNVQSIFRELNDSAYGQEIEGFDDLGGQKRLEEIKKELAQAGIVHLEEKREVEGLSIKALNKAVLNYQVEKLDEKPVKGWDTIDQDEIASN
ncbi:MAG: hypothetical protein E2O68_05855 [Deltaproteobacteria bacterium]|nr:MAG: hypothetical protein E2O68_05855 [Deltaproteobacteria bacterium]